MTDKPQIQRSVSIFKRTLSFLLFAYRYYFLSVLSFFFRPWRHVYKIMTASYHFVTQHFELIFYSISTRMSSSFAVSPDWTFTFLICQNKRKRPNSPNRQEGSASIDAATLTSVHLTDAATSKSLIRKEWTLHHLLPGRWGVPAPSSLLSSLCHSVLMVD